MRTASLSRKLLNYQRAERPSGGRQRGSGAAQQAQEDLLECISGVKVGHTL